METTELAAALFFVDAGGVFLGSFIGAAPPAGAVAVAAPPEDGRQVWDSVAWRWPVDILRREAKARVDEEAERRRLVYLTPGAGQSMVYQEKRREAERFAADSDPDPLDYPLLSAEIGITGPDLASVGVKILATANAWAQIAARIEATRLGAKRAIDDVPDSPNARADIDGVLAGIDWVA